MRIDAQFIRFAVVCALQTLVAFRLGAAGGFGTSNLLVLGATCYFKQSAGVARSSFRGNVQLKTDPKVWSLDYQDSMGHNISTMFDGEAIFTLRRDLNVSGTTENRVMDLAEISFSDAPPMSSAPGLSLPWFGALACRLIKEPTARVVPSWVSPSHAPAYSARFGEESAGTLGCRSIRFTIQPAVWNSLAADPRSGMRPLEITNAFTEAEFVIQNSTNVFGFEVPLIAEMRRYPKPGYKPIAHSTILLTVTNVEVVRGKIEKPAFRHVTQVSDVRGNSTTPYGSWRPLERPMIYFASNWLDSSDPEWSEMVLKNLTAELSQPGAIGIRFGNVSSGFRRVEEVFAGSPAERAGLLAGDLLLAIDGNLVAATNCTTSGAVGTTATVVFVRNAVTNTVQIRRTRIKPAWIKLNP